MRFAPFEKIEFIRNSTGALVENCHIAPGDRGNILLPRTGEVVYLTNNSGTVLTITYDYGPGIIRIYITD